MLRFENVGLRYGMGQEVVSDVNFSIAPQSFQFLTGPSGAGKTTILRLMLLSLRPTRGTIRIFGHDAAALRKDQVTALRRRIGVVFQDFRLLDHLTTYENVALPLRAMGRAEVEYRAEVVELLKWVGLGDRMNASPPILSGGEKQRAAIARALIVRPELLLADEPTGNVDPGLARRLLRLFIELHRLGTAVVIATHDLHLMDQFGFARRLVVGDGKVAIFDGIGLMTKPVDDKRLALSTESIPKRDIPLIPRDSVAGRALVVVIAIMSFLASLTAGGALLIAQASQSWRSEVVREVTIQIKPDAGEDVDSLVGKAVSVSELAPGVEGVHAYSAAESATLLQPWLGEGIDLSLLPIPRIIVVHMQKRSADDLGALREALARAVPQANLDDHRRWAARIGTMANAIVGLAAVVFALMMAAMLTAIGFATRGAMAENREIVEVLHLVGASDVFIAREFQTNFRRLGFRGALIGGASAMAFFLGMAGLFSWGSNSAGRTEIAAMFGAFALGPAGYLALAGIGAAIALLTGFLSRAIVFRHLRDLL